MTSIVGVYCKDGVVLGADSSVTFTDSEQRHTIEQSAEKIGIFGDKVIIAGAGALGLDQRFRAIVADAVSKNKLKGTHLDIAKNLSGATIEDFRTTYAPTGKYGALAAFPAIGKGYLFEFGMSDFQPEFRTEENWFASMGSVQKITDSFLAFLRSVFWENEQPNVNEGMFATKWTLDHAVAVNPGGVNAPVRIAVLEKNRNKFIARMVPEEEIEEHQNMIIDVKSAMVEFMQSHKEPEKLDIQPVPLLDPSEGEREESTLAGDRVPTVKEILEDAPKDQSTVAEEILAKAQPEEEKKTKRRKRKN